MCVPSGWGWLRSRNHPLLGPDPAKIWRYMYMKLEPYSGTSNVQNGGKMEAATKKIGLSRDTK